MKPLTHAAGRPLTTHVGAILGNLALGAFIFILSCAPDAWGQEIAAVQGEIVALPCYMVNASRGSEYAACALLGAQLGAVPIGVLTDTDELFLLVNESADPTAYDVAKELAGQRAELTGKIVSRRGVASLIVESAREL